MELDDPVRQRAERLKLLTQTTRDTLMGTLLRKFWHPIALSRIVAKGQAKPLQILGEELTLYRGESGLPHLVGGRCAHRRTVLHTGWVQGEELRCIYHGWKYDGTGQCTERPAERDTSRPDISIPGYPVREYCGMIFAYLGEGAAPDFELPRKEAFERPGVMLFPREEIWGCNWFQHIENSMDATHVSFVHRMGKVGTFGEAVSSTIPDLTYTETDAGIKQVATRGPNSVRISDWTFPNHNHINQPGLDIDEPWVDIGTWMVPIDDKRTLRYTLWVVPSFNEAADRRVTEYFRSIENYSPADHHDALFYEAKYPDDILVTLTNAQDYVAQMGQGTITDREMERLGRSDSGIVLLRRLFWRELDCLRQGQPIKAWRKLERPTELPIQVAEPAEA